MEPLYVTLGLILVWLVLGVLGAWLCRINWMRTLHEEAPVGRMAVAIIFGPLGLLAGIVAFLDGTEVPGGGRYLK